ncbi:multiple epidermal growth factor-like domains protein 10 isoform X2 [Haliotis rufescens]|uniref:multiple epidermal growth factor-like domains protein 10 isoform X2 n=1 Tax=Haliotis rufescens TaxID=6454 RepID=UPI00201EF6A9|nr:multiple epidermal growth factor-like domains protein 10 isoform X2 [Haliotis rufescens]
MNNATSKTRSGIADTSRRQRTTSTVNVRDLPCNMQTGFFVSAVITILTGGTLAQNGCNIKCADCIRSRCRECYYGFWGSDCTHNCVNCWLGGCNKHTGKCVQCSPGRYSTDCSKLCPNNCRYSSHDKVTHCGRSEGRCLEGCKEGWWGTTCGMPCSTGCKSACYQADGDCISDCRPGWYSMRCDTQCSMGCLSGTCDWLTGVCVGDCKNGYDGPNCEDICSKNCQSTCQYDETSDGLYCSAGCRDGWTSLYCNETCGSRCHVCPQHSGSCTTCKTGYYGRFCQLTCPEKCKACDQISGLCTECIEGKVCDKDARSYEEAGYDGNSPEENDIEESYNSAEGHQDDSRRLFTGLILLFTFWTKYR